MIKLLLFLLPSSAAASCPTLQDLFPADGLYEHNLYDCIVKSSHVVGDRFESHANTTYSNPGDQDLWYDNPLGSYDDGTFTDIVGTSSGVCNLLPPSGNASQCLSVFTFEDYGTLVMSSLWPNNIVEHGQLIIVGGTKCFENVLGTISVLATDDTWEYFQYKLVNDAVEECQDVDFADMFNTTYTPPSLYEVVKNDTFLPAWLSEEGQGPSLGDRDLWHNNWLMSNNSSVSNDDDLVGFASGYCNWVHQDFCIGLETFVFDNASRITQIMFNVSEQEILGGTNCFLGEKGAMDLVIYESGMYQYNIQPEVKMSDCDDVSLEEILSSGLRFEHADVVFSAFGGDGSGQVGDAIVWLDNLVFDESLGSAIGSVYGWCNVLPPEGNAALCLVKLYLDNAGDASDVGSITFIGIAPNADGKPAPMAVVSGNGCFRNPTVKSLYYTRKESYGYFTIQSSLEGDNSSPSSSITVDCFILFCSLVSVAVLCN